MTQNKITKLTAQYHRGHRQEVGEEPAQRGQPGADRQRDQQQETDADHEREGPEPLPEDHTLEEGPELHPGRGGRPIVQTIFVLRSMPAMFFIRLPRADGKLPVRSSYTGREGRQWRPEHHP